MPKNILLICGGNNTEHDISIKSSDFIKENLEGYEDFNIIQAIIGKDNIIKKFPENKNISYHDLLKNIDFAIPCIHGHPGETGDIQSIFETYNIPYLGSGPEASILSFNKISSKLWYNGAHIKNSPFTFLSDMSDIKKAKDFFSTHQRVFVKASNQGSSVGCYPVTEKSKLEETIKKAFNYSPWVLIEKMISGRELEIAVYEYDGKLAITDPGEIASPDGFYSYEEKYNKNSQTETIIKASGISEIKNSEMKQIALKAFKFFKLKHLSRVDFFLTSDNEVLLNEINTFPGMTPISMFPVLLEANGHSFKDFVYKIIKSSLL